MRTARNTRGNTVAGRLRLLDRWLLASEAALLCRDDGPWAEAAVVDVGVGARPLTTVELARAARALRPGLAVVGLDNDPARVVVARALAGDEVVFEAGNLGASAACRLVRAMNVLRQYPAEVVPEALARLGAPLLPGGLLVEGSSSHSGHVLAARTLRRTRAGLRLESLVFATDFSDGFAPGMFRGPLPQGLRAPWGPGNLAFEVIERWSAAWVGGAVETAFAASVQAAGGRVVGGAAVFSVGPARGEGVEA